MQLNLTYGEPKCDGIGYRIFNQRRCLANTFKQRDWKSQCIHRVVCVDNAVRVSTYAAMYMRVDRLLRKQLVNSVEQQLRLSLLLQRASGPFVVAKAIAWYIPRCILVVGFAIALRYRRVCDVSGEDDRMCIPERCISWIACNRIAIPKDMRCHG